MYVVVMDGLAAFPRVRGGRRGAEHRGTGSRLCCDAWVRVLNPGGENTARERRALEGAAWPRPAARHEASSKLFPTEQCGCHSSSNLNPPGSRSCEPRAPRASTRERPAPLCPHRARGPRSSRQARSELRPRIRRPGSWGPAARREQSRWPPARPGAARLAPASLGGSLLECLAFV